MRAVVQRVNRGSVAIDGKTIAEIGKGLVILLGVGKEDSEKDAKYLADKIVNLRVFEDNDGKMNQSVTDICGELLVVSQFTLYGDCRKGRRPSFTDSAPPVMAENLYNYFVGLLRMNFSTVQTGSFQAYMEVQIHNDGPVTLILDTASK